MKTTSRRDLPARAGMVLVIAAALAVIASPALADTSQASSTAAALRLGTASVLTTGVSGATNDGSGEVTTGNTNPALALLGAQNVLVAGVLAQQAEANSDGTSAACAGVAGNGGIIAIGNQGVCTATNLPTGGVQLNIGASVLNADAILAQCTAASDGTVTGSATIANLTLLGGGISVPLNPSPNFGLTIGGLVQVIFNRQVINAGAITVDALYVSLLPNTPLAVELRIGTASCGPNAVTPPIPAVDPAGLPLAAGVALVGGGIVLWFHRRRRAVSTV